MKWTKAQQSAIEDRGVFLLLCGCLFQPRKALIADNVFNPAGVGLRSPGVNACGDKLLGKKAVALIDFFGNLGRS